MHLTIQHKAPLSRDCEGDFQIAINKCQSNVFTYSRRVWAGKTEPPDQIYEMCETHGHGLLVHRALEFNRN